MKKMRIFALAIAAILLLSVLAGCSTSASAITVRLVLRTSPDAEPYFDQEIKLNAEAPTVELVVNEANATYPDLGITWAESGSLQLPDYLDQSYEDGSYDMWVCLVNGAEPTGGRAKNAAVADGDTVEYTYTHGVVEETAAAQ